MTGTQKKINSIPDETRTILGSQTETPIQLKNPNLPGFDTSYFNPFVLWFLAETHCIWYVLPKYCNCVLEKN